MELCSRSRGLRAGLGDRDRVDRVPAQAQEVHAAIRAQLAAENAEVAKGVRLLYGGSVKAASAAELFGMPDIDGGW